MESLISDITADPDSPSTEGELAQASQSFLALRVEQVWYAVRAQQVTQIVPQAAAVPVPGTPPFVLGLLSSAGRIVTLLDPRQLLAIPRDERSRESEAPPRDLILTEDGLTFALRVDEVSDLVEIPVSEVRPMDDAANGVASGVFVRGAQALTVLEVGRLLALAERRVSGES